MSQVSDSTSYQNATQRLQDSFDTERADARANNEKQIQKVKDEAEETIAKNRANYKERLETERAQARDEVNRLKEDLYDRSGKKTAKEAADQQATRKEFSEYRDQVKKEADRKVARVEDASGRSAVRRQEIEDQKISDALTAQKRSSYQEIKELQDDLSEYQSSGRDVQAEKAKARHDAIAEGEKNHLDEKNQIIKSYEHQIASMKDHQEQMGEHYERQLSDATFDANTQAQKQINIQRQEFGEIHKNDVADKQRMELAHENQLRDAKQFHDRSSNNLINKNNEDRQKIVADKDATYQDYIAHKDEKFTYEIGERDAKIKELQTTDDPLRVSPFVAKRINDSADERNYKALTKAQETHDKNLTAVRKRDVEERRDMTRQYQMGIAGAHREARKEQDLQNRQLRDSFSDLQEQHENDVSTFKEQKRDVTEKLYQKHAIELSQAQRDKQDALGEQRDVMLSEKNAVVDDEEHSKHLQNREWSMKANDIRRNFETKLAEERDQHEQITGEIKAEYDKKLRDQSRISARTLDDRVRSYEHLIAQQDVAFKEKERFLTEHYEEELDKMKRTNAHLIQKKS